MNDDPMTDKNQGGAPPGNQNRTLHGLRASGLPPGCSYLEGQLASFRRHVRDEISRDGATTTYQEACLQSAIRHETRALLAARWLRLEGDGLKLTDRLALLDTISRATDSRDKCLERLGLDATAADAITAFYSTPADSDALDGRTEDED